MLPELNNFWTLTVDELATRLQTNIDDGLPQSSIAERRLQFGLNLLEQSQKITFWTLFSGQFIDLMIVLLAVAAAISAIVGDWTDTLLIGVIVLANALIGAFQEWKAEKSLEALRDMSQPLVRVRRDSAWSTIPTQDLLPGDVIAIKSGDVIPADGRVVSTASLEINESTLTGESLPIAKVTSSLAAPTLLADRANMIHMGTAVAGGHGTAIVTAIGSSTQLGQIAQSLETARPGQTPLQRRLASMSRSVAIAVVALCLVIFLTGVLRTPRDDWSRGMFGELLLLSVSLAVAAIPEGLPAVITITLALGAQRMARRNAIVRRLTAVESLGSVNVICSDKTGTLTQNKMVVADLLSVDHSESGRRRMLESLVLCSNAEIGRDDVILGSATEVAILTAAQRHGVNAQELRLRYPRTAEVPFSSERKQMLTVHKQPDGQHMVFAKGAADRIIPQCQSHGPALVQEWIQKAEELASSGRRVLACAVRSCAGDYCLDDGPEEGSYELLGIVGIVDPVREEARDAIAICRSAGIRTVMITGDHAATARAVGGELDMIREGDKLLTGADLEGMTQPELVECVRSTACYARVSPQHKLRIVQAAQSLGDSVAMTGDGVNDAPALKQSDIGVAMGINGTEVSKEAAAMILSDDNFATIVAAVEEGRIVYDNIRKFVAYLLTANLSEVLVILGAMLLGLPVPLLPVHLLWINLVTDGLPALALGFEPGERTIMRRPPRSRGESLFANGLGWNIVLIGGLMGLLCVALFVIELGRQPGGEDLTRPRTMVFFVLAVSQLIYVCGIRSFTDSLLQIGFWSNWRLTAAILLGIGLQLATVYVPVLQRVFHTHALSAKDIAMAFAWAVIPFVAVEAWKWLHRRLAGRRSRSIPQ